MARTYYLLFYNSILLPQPIHNKCDSKDFFKAFADGYYESKHCLSL